MKHKEIKEGLADAAHKAEMDHEVQMARADLYKLAKYSIKLHELLKNVSEAEGLEGWGTGQDYQSRRLHQFCVSLHGL